MACEEDPFVYVFEDGYTSDEEDISDSLVSGIVEEAFKRERMEGNKNPHSQGGLYPSNSDLENVPHDNRRISSEECLPMIKITEISGDGSAASNNLNRNDMADNKPRFTASDSFLPEKTVRFTPPSASSENKKKYPTTPKCAARNLGPSLSPMKSQPNESSSTAEDEMSRLSSLNCFPDSPCDMSPHNPSPCSPAPLTGHLKDADAHMASFEEDLIKLNCAVTHMEAKLLLNAQQHGYTEPARCGSKTQVTGENDWTDIEQNLQDAVSFLQSVNLKWTVHKRHLDDFLSDTQRLEGGYFLLGNRIAEQNNVILRLKEERRALEEFLQDKEYEWFMVKKSQRADTNFIKGLVKEAENCRDADALWKVLDAFLLIHLDRERAIALDTAKQSKMNELRLLIYRQQLHLSELEERNRELECEIRHQAGLSPLPCDCNSSCLKDVLYCDHSTYSPLCSTSPEFASLQILNIGGPHPDLAFERRPLLNTARLFHQKDGHESAADLAEYDQTLLKELTEHGPGSRDFRFE